MSCVDVDVDDVKKAWARKRPQVRGERLKRVNMFARVVKAASVALVLPGSEGTFWEIHTLYVGSRTS